MSLDRRDEIVTSPNRYDLTIGSDKSSSLSRSEVGTYDVHQAEARIKTGENGVAHHNNNNGSPTSPTVNGNGTFSSDEVKKRKWPTEQSYFLAKELQMTERTYKKDLEIITNHFQEKLSPEKVAQLQPLFQIFDSMLQHHNIMLRDLEHRMVLWEGRGAHDTHRIGDVMLRNMAVLPVYDEYIESHLEILHRVYEMFENDPDFQDVYQEFEQQKICYLPIAYLLLKPMQRLLHYKIILERLVEFYSESHLDNSDCQGVLNIILRTSNVIKEVLPESENFILLCELQRDISGFPTLVETNRQLVRQGLLLKHSKRGLQQRMFFLFSDILLYGYKPPISQVFKILGHIPVRSLMTENAEHNTFMIYGGGGEGAITVSAGTTAEKTLWLAELSRATADIKGRPVTDNLHGSLKKYSSSEENLEVLGYQSSLTQNGTNTLSAGNTSTLPTKQPSSRSNTALHVCWHRGATVGINDHLVSAENQLSGYLLRKFKNSSGWQKLWVVFTSFCLYFYKSYQDEFALASLPLLGYTVGPPGHMDNVLKEFVFKLSFKNHEYFFRADSIHTYNRWMEVLRSTTQTQDFKNINFHS